MEGRSNRRQYGKSFARPPGSQLVAAGRQRPDVVNARYLCVERNYGTFRREIVIGIPIDYKQAKAELRNGLMKIHLPKVPERGGQDQIPIE